MNAKIRSILAALETYKQTPESVGLELRLSLSQTILRHLKANRWTQATLAKKTGMKEPFISRVLHSNANCTLDTAGKLLFALGIRARFEETVSGATQSTLRIADYKWQGDTDGPSGKTIIAATTRREAQAEWACG